MDFEQLMADLWAKGWNDNDFAALSGKSGQEFTDVINFINGLKAGGGDQNTLIRQRFPQMAWALDHPELGPMLKRAVGEGWDPARLQGELLKTNWFRTTTENERLWDRRNQEDPAEGQKMFYDSVSRVDSMAKRLGVSLTQDQIYNFAISAGRSAWEDSTLTQKILEQAKFGGEGKLSGQMNSAVDQIKQTANDYFAPIADSEAFEMARKMLGGGMDSNTLGAYFKDLAVSRFQGNEQITGMLDRGFTAAQIFAPHIQQAAQLLELTPSQINLMDPKYSQILDYRDEKGNARPMSLTEAGRFIRGTDAYNTTQQATDQASNFAEMIARKFGAVA